MSNSFRPQGQQPARPPCPSLFPEVCLSSCPLQKYYALKSRFPGDPDAKEGACNAGDPGLIPGSGRSPEGNGYPVQYSCLENSMDRGVWWATVHEFTESDVTVTNTHTCMPKKKTNKQINRKSGPIE